MPIQFKFIPIIPKKLFSEKTFKDAANKVLREEAKAVKTEFAKTTKTFKHRVSFSERDTSTGHQLSRLVFTSDEPYFFVVRGTRIRWALMSSDFSAKTSVRVIGSKGGSGGAVIIGKRAMQARGIAPRPGIKAREFDLEIIKIRQPKFKRNAIRAFVRAAEKSK